MWKTFSVDNGVYMLRTTNENETYKIDLCDLQTIWSRTYSRDDIVKNFQEFNPIIVVEPEEAVEQTVKIFDQIDNATVSIDRGDNEIDIKITSEALGIADVKCKIKYELNLSKEEQSKFTEEVTAPMVHTINYLETQQRMLCDLVKKKDRELEEYRLEKGDISRADLVTEKFNPNVLNPANDKLILNVYGESEKFWQSFIEKYGNIEANILKVNVEPWNQGKRKRKSYKAKTVKKYAPGVLFKKE